LNILSGFDFLALANETTGLDAKVYWHAEKHQKHKCL
jgi:hypothetical protein